MKKTFLRQTTIKLTKHNESQKQIKVSIPQFTNNSLLHRKYTRSISSFNNIPVANDNLERKNSASHRKMSRSKVPQDPIKNMENMFLQPVQPSSEEQILRDIYFRFSSCMSLAQESKEIRLEKLLKTMKVYIGGMLKSLLEIEENRMRMMINKVTVLASSYEKKMQQLQNLTVQKLKNQRVSKQSELGKKIQQLTFRTTFTNIILNQFEKSGINIDQMIRQSTFMKNFTKSSEESNERGSKKSYPFGEFGENEFLLSQKSGSMHTIGGEQRS